MKRKKKRQEHMEQIKEALLARDISQAQMESEMKRAQQLLDRRKEQENKLYLDPQDIPPVEGETYEVVASCHNCATIGKYRIPVGRKWTDYWEGMWLSPEGSSHYAIGAGREQVHCFNCGYAMLIRGPRMEVEK